MFTKGSSVAALAAVLLAQSSYAQKLDKPVVNPQFYPKLDPQLDKLPLAKYTITDFKAGFIPQDCKTMAEGEKLSANDIEAFNIKYDDCSDPWIFCRHKDAPNSRKDMAEHWGKIPVKMRSYIRHIIAIPGTASAYNSGNNILIRSGVSPMTIYGHETGHSLDADAFNTPGGFSKSQKWIDAYNKDPNVVQDYAQASQQENLAQVNNVALFDKNVKGGIASITDASKFKNQLAALENNIAAGVLQPGGTCSGRKTNSPAVPKSGSAKFLLFLRDAPDVSLSPYLEVIESRSPQEKHETFFDENWNPIMETRSVGDEKHETFFDENWNAIAPSDN